MLPIMKGPRRLWIVVAAVAVLLASHGVVLYYVSSHLAASAAVFAAIFVLVVLKHLGLLGPFYAMLRKRRSRP